MRTFLAGIGFAVLVLFALLVAWREWIRVPFDPARLAEATYILDGAWVPLERGVHIDRDIRTNLAVRTWLSDVTVFGDVNDDGVKDAAVIVLRHTGGAEIFSYLSVLITKDGAPQAIPGLLLGNRVEVRSLSIVDGIVWLTIVDRSANDAFGNLPAIERYLRFKVAGGALIKT